MVRREGATEIAEQNNKGDDADAENSYYAIDEESEGSCLSDLERWRQQHNLINYQREADHSQIEITLETKRLRSEEVALWLAAEQMRLQQPASENTETTGVRQEEETGQQNAIRGPHAVQQTEQVEPSNALAAIAHRDEAEGTGTQHQHFTNHQQETGSRQAENEDKNRKAVIRDESQLVMAKRWKEASKEKKDELRAKSRACMKRLRAKLTEEECMRGLVSSSLHTPLRFVLPVISSCTFVTWP